MGDLNKPYMENLKLLNQSKTKTYEHDNTETKEKDKITFKDYEGLLLNKKLTFGSKIFDLTIYSDPKNKNHFLRKLTLKSDFENRVNMVNDYNCFWVVRGNKIRKSHDWVGRICHHFFIKDTFTYEILSVL